MKPIALAVAAVAAAIAASATAEPLKIRIGWSTTPAHVTPMLLEIPNDVYRHWGKSYPAQSPAFASGHHLPDANILL